MNNIDHRGRTRSNKILDDDTKRRANNKRHRSGKTKRIPLVIAIFIDLLIAALAMYIFWLNYFLLPQDLSENAQLLPSTVVAEASPTTTANAWVSIVPTDAPTSTAEKDHSMWGAKFHGVFTDGTVETTDNSYKSANISVTVDTVQTDEVTYYVANIYLKNLNSIKTAFATGVYGVGLHEQTDVIAAENNAVLAINGDYCSNNAGPVVRNGILYREEIYKDVLVMNNDGSMETLTAEQLDMEQVKSEGVYQIWTFGPMLLKDGQPITQFDSTLTAANPRTAIGYYEPGHYCFVVVDGRQPGYSNGMTLQQMSELFYNLGCTVAYNLDGGQTSEMVFRNEFVNRPYNGGRRVSDIVYITDISGE